MTKNPFERNSWGHEIWDDATKTLRTDNDKLYETIETLRAKLGAIDYLSSVAIKNLTEENEAFRAKLVKAEAVIDIAAKYSVGWLYAWKNEFNDAYDKYQETEETSTQK